MVPMAPYSCQALGASSVADRLPCSRHFGPARMPVAIVYNLLRHLDPVSTARISCDGHALARNRSPEDERRSCQGQATLLMIHHPDSHSVEYSRSSSCTPDLEASPLIRQRHRHAVAGPTLRRSLREADSAFFLRLPPLLVGSGRTFFSAGSTLACLCLPETRRSSMKPEILPIFWRTALWSRPCCPPRRPYDAPSHLSLSGYSFCIILICFIIIVCIEFKYCDLFFVILIPLN